LAGTACDTKFDSGKRHSAGVAVVHPVGDPIVVAVELDALDDMAAVGQRFDAAFVELVAFDALHSAVGAVGVGLPHAQHLAADDDFPSCRLLEAVEIVVAVDLVLGPARPGVLRLLRNRRLGVEEVRRETSCACARRLRVELMQGSA
jgi:hypothetical protein